MQGAIPDQPISVQRRELDMEDYLDIVRRHRAWIIGPAFLGLVLGVMIAYLWPDTYTSTGQIRVVPPQVSSRLVASNLNEEMNQRVNTIYQNIIGRESLSNMIQSYNLYPDKRRRLPTEDVLELMKKDIVPSPLRGLNTVVGGGRVFAFSVSYSYSDRRTARLVCQDLLTKFLTDASAARSSESSSATDFFKQEVQTAKQDLEEIDRKIADFKAANTGALPEEAQSLLFLVSSTDQNIQNLSMSVNRASQDKLQLEAQLHFQEEQLPAPATAPVANAAPGSAPAPVIRDQHLDDLDRDIGKAEETLSVLRQSYKDSHPDVQRVMNSLVAKRKERDQYAAQLSSAKPVAIPGRSGPSQTVTASANSSRELRASIARLQAQIQAKDMELEEFNRQIEAARTRSKTLQAQVAASPLARSAYMALLRDRENAATRYQGMTLRLQDSRLSTDLDTRGQGETLEQLEAASTPSTPSAPRRPMIIFVAAALGIALGIGVAIARELRDVSLKSLKDVRAYTRLTILGSVPLLENDFVVRRRRRMAWLGWSAAFVIGVLLMSGSVIYYYTSKS
jgi:polysaccharide chain length determinant protein (PEP-CTERM system associated)